LVTIFPGDSIEAPIRNTQVSKYCRIQGAI
jgi:hypothetical protein